MTPAPPTRDPDVATPGVPAPDPQERRKLVIAGALFFGALLAVIAVVALFSGDAGDERPDATTVPCAAGDTECRIAQQSAERPGIIPLPGEGTEPREAGDRGGIEQVAVLVVMIAGVGLVILLVVRSSRRARAARAEATATSSGPPPPPG